MNIDYVSTAITLVVVGLILWFLRRASLKKPSYSAKRVMLLKLPGFYTVFGYIFMGVAGIFAFVLAINVYKTLDIFLILGGIILFFLAVGLWIALYSLRYFVECDEQGVRLHGLIGKVKEISWREVSSVKFHKFAMSLSLTGPDGRVKVYILLKGFPDFVELMKEKLNSRLYGDALTDMARSRMNW